MSAFQILCFLECYPPESGVRYTIIKSLIHFTFHLGIEMSSLKSYLLCHSSIFEIILELFIHLYTQLV
jgi:hypothetical protein